MRLLIKSGFYTLSHVTIKSGLQISFINHVMCKSLQHPAFAMTEDLKEEAHFWAFTSKQWAVHQHTSKNFEKYSRRMIFSAVYKFSIATIVFKNLNDTLIENEEDMRKRWTHPL